RPWSEVKKSYNREHKSIRSKNFREWVYQDRQGNPLIKVRRVDDGQGQKKQWQEHWNGQKWVKGYGQIKKEDIPIYRYREIREAIARGETIFVVEGEPCADILWNRGIPATTNIGGSGKWLASHTKDLESAKSIVLSPDRDKPGVKHMEDIASGIPSAKWLYPFPDCPLWNQEIPPNKGLDVLDWIKDQKITKEDIFNSLEEQPRNFKLRNNNQNNNNIRQHTTSLTEPRNAVTSKPLNSIQGNLSPEDEVSIPFDKLLLEEIDNLVEQNFLKGELNAKIIALASNFRRGTKEIWKLYYSRAEELEQAENRETTKEEVNRLLKIQDYQLKLKKYLQPTLADPLEKLAFYLGVNNATLLTSLLTTTASLLPIDTKLELIKATGFYARPILYAGICAPSGSGKSPAQKAILKPLFELQEEEDRRYNLELGEYKQQLQEYKRHKKNPEIEEPEPPQPPREYFVTDATSEAIANIQNNQPNNGFLGYFDELKQLVGQSNSYRGGKGADIEKLLSGRDGSGFKVNRASGKRISCPRSGYSILGGIQPDVLRKQMGDFSDGNGFWARFIWVNQPMQRKPFPDDETNIVDTTLLRSVYEFLGTIDNTFVLSKEAKEKYKDWYNFVEDQKFQEAKPALQAVWSKSQRLVGELALLIHCLTYAIYQQQPPQEVEPEILSAAISLAKFYLGQVKLIHADGDSEDNSQPNTYTKLIELSKRKGWITARDVKAGIRNYRNTTPNLVRSLFREIEALGYGITQGTGNKLKWKYQTVGTVNTADNSVDTVSTVKKSSVTTTNQSSQAKTIDTVEKNLAPPTEKTQSHSHHTVDNKINTSVNKLSTENPEPQLDRPIDSSSTSSSTRSARSTENPEPQLDRPIDSSSTSSSTRSTRSTENLSDNIAPTDVSGIKENP
ncbi:MAG: DUF3987 domain-containing protein, partial [Cyanobacteriota bacterium]|nr:DUF3987 domain-containing protein [Cyanobacteriota bacterium]